MHVSIENWMDEQNVVYAYNKILFSLKKDRNSDTCYNMYKRVKGPDSILIKELKSHKLCGQKKKKQKTNSGDGSTKYE